ncbi:MAG TPA: hypothetical protein IAB23_04410 [Candidatus Scybalocola faecavium]|nr:hypothetical protein [Candidatus Scybalocola faecavium]
MTVRSLIQQGIFSPVCIPEDTSGAISIPFCCDLLSIAMSRAPSGAAWVTVMANINTLAVASLTECACIILAEGAAFDETCEKKALQEGIPVFSTPMPVFEAALKVWQLLQAEKCG